ncbi:MAG: hypothetical protein CVT79_12600 [Alphaproteobacteria bacterium HGW-Alphaproteobacteria-18]|nr:MAG: hypothetical protein CVT79_12600 [Alphaproteobacteria bacterium HGW-Alphaproteobacteria-18]
MGGYPPYAGFTEFAIALGVILSAIVSLLGTSSRKRMVAMGEARLQDLSEMTGILDPKQLFVVFGPPDMGRVWRNVTLLDLRRARAPAGWLMSSDLVDYGCMLAAILGMLFNHSLIPLLLLGALGVQAAGWIVSARVPK